MDVERAAGYKNIRNYAPAKEKNKFPKKATPMLTYLTAAGGYNQAFNAAKNFAGMAISKLDYLMKGLSGPERVAAMGLIKSNLDKQPKYSDQERANYIAKQQRLRQEKFAATKDTDAYLKAGLGWNHLVANDLPEIIQETLREAKKYLPEGFLIKVNPGKMSIIMLNKQNNSGTGFLPVSKMGLTNANQYKFLTHPAVKVIIKYNMFATAINGFKKWATSDPITAQSVASKIQAKAINLAIKGLAYARQPQLKVQGTFAQGPIGLEILRRQNQLASMAQAIEGGRGGGGPAAQLQQNLSPEQIATQVASDIIQTKGGSTRQEIQMQYGNVTGDFGEMPKGFTTLVRGILESQNYEG